MMLLRHGESLFNAVFNKTRQDPGFVDPELTPVGRDQALSAARALSHERFARIVVSPYTRALQTAAIVSEELGVPIAMVTPLIRERYAFTCDIGTPASELARSWPDLDFQHIDEIWWPLTTEPAADIEARAREFRAVMCADPAWADTLVVSHWGFILALTGERFTNCQAGRCDPREAHPAEIRWHH